MYLDIKTAKEHHRKHVDLCFVTVTRSKTCKTEIYTAGHNFYGETVHDNDSSALENA